MSKLRAFLLFALTLLISSCSRPAAVTADSIIRTACELLAMTTAEDVGVSADALIATSCAVEDVTRKMRDRLLAEQLSAARTAGLIDPVEVPEGAAAPAAPPAPAAPAEPPPAEPAE